MKSLFWYINQVSEMQISPLRKDQPSFDRAYNKPYLITYSKFQSIQQNLMQNLKKNDIWKLLA